MVAVNIAANHWYLHVCTWHMYMTFPQNVSFHANITCLWPGETEGTVVELQARMLPVAAVQDCVSTFISVKPLEFFKADLRTISSHVCGHKTRYFKAKNDCSLSITKWFLWEKWKIETLHMWSTEMYIAKNAFWRNFIQKYKSEWNFTYGAQSISRCRLWSL